MPAGLGNEGKVGWYAQPYRLARPYRKNEQAFVESFHRTLRKECLGWCNYKLGEMEELQKEVQEYLDYYHYEWPRLGLDMEPLCHLAMAFDMRDTDDLTSARHSGKIILHCGI